MSKASHEIPFILWTWGSIIVFIRYHHHPYCVPDESHPHPPITFGKTSIIHPPKHVVSSLWGFQSEACMKLSCAPCVPHTHLSYHLWFYNLKIVCSGVQIMKLLFMQFIQPPVPSTWGVQMASSPPYSWTPAIYVLTKNYIPIKHICIHTHMCTHKFRWEGAQFLMMIDFSKFCKCSENHCW
jgi:hypothetical protein